MWSLPSIANLNERAAANANDLRKQVRSQRVRKHECEHYNCRQRATYGVLYYDIFSDDPKDIEWRCQDHEDEIADSDGLFVCADCGRLMITNYTWELYHKDGVCLKCAAERYAGNPHNWIDPAKVKGVEFLGEDHGIITGDGIVNLSAVPHVLAVQQPLPKGIKFIPWSNVESLDKSQERIAQDVLDEIQEKTNGRKFLLVLDSAWQFSISYGLYVKSEEDEDGGEPFGPSAPRRCTDMNPAPKALDPAAIKLRRIPARKNLPDVRVESRNVIFNGERVPLERCERAVTVLRWCRCGRCDCCLIGQAYCAAKAATSDSDAP